MAFIKFLLKPKNELEYGGRKEAMQADENEPVKTCPNCHKDIPISYLHGNAHICKCGYHFRMNGRQRIHYFLDPGSFEEYYADLVAEDVLEFPGYERKIKSSQNACDEAEAVICGKGRIAGKPCCVFFMEPYFMMASMGCAVGEKIARTFELAAKSELPVIGFTVSGGARMQEGILSLMQMAKTSAAVRRHSDAGLFYCSVLTNPTTGGVTASFAMEADIIMAEPGAVIGFAGARVIEQTTRKKLPHDFQKAEFMLKHGFIDAIVQRSELPKRLGDLLKIHDSQTRNIDRSTEKGRCEQNGIEQCL